MSFDNITKIDAIFIYSSDKSRILGQYYTNRIAEDQKEIFEGEIFDRAQQDPESVVFLHKDYLIAIYRDNDFISFIIGDKKCNELIFDEIHRTFFTALEMIISSKVETLTLTENMGSVYLTLDNLIDQGYPFIIEPDEIFANVSMKDSDTNSRSSSATSKAATLFGFLRRF